MTFRCGHERTPANTKTNGPGGSRCRTCWQSSPAQRRAKTKYERTVKGQTARALIRVRLNARRRGNS